MPLTCKLEPKNPFASAALLERAGSYGDASPPVPGLSDRGLASRHGEVELSDLGSFFSAVKGKGRNFNQLPTAARPNNV